MPKYRKIMLLLEIAFYLLIAFLILDFITLSVDGSKNDNASKFYRERLTIDEQISTSE